jgi:VanZ family protein
MQRLFLILAWFSVFLIVVLSIVPASLRPVSGLPHALEHFLIFLITGAAFALAYPGRQLVNCGGLTAFAGLVEIAQIWSFGRHARISDFIVDALAALIGVGLAWIVLKTRLGVLLNPP